ncbi:hypothetical protein [Xylella fastidiosa]
MNYPSCGYRRRATVGAVRAGVGEGMRGVRGSGMLPVSDRCWRL